MNRQVQFLLTAVLFCSWVDLMYSHGRLWDPVNRSSMWRLGFKTPINYQDHELYCGGFAHQVKMGYKCGLCGDPYDGVRENESGGKYATGTIAQTYKQGQKATFQVDLTANHLGYFEFKICPRDDLDIKETQKCFDQNPVSLADGSGTKYYIGRESKMYNIDVILPPHVTCDFCVLQWRYHVGNSWGSEANGTSCVGCGMQEEFYGCADIRILADDQLNETSSPVVDEEEPHVTEEQTTESPAEEFPDTHNHEVDCRGINGRENLDNWCLMNCKLNNCPSSHCICKGQKALACKATSGFSNMPGHDQWCINNCAAGYCPSSRCICTK